MWRVLFIAFLIAHGAVHLAVWLSPINPDGPFDPSHSWLLGDQRVAAIALAVVAGALLMVGGVGLWMAEPWWRTLALAGLAASLVLMVLYFHPWFLPIEIINAALIIALLWLDWPSETFVGA